MKFDGRLEERTSKKGNPYRVLVLSIFGDYEKTVFLSDAEAELIALQYED